MDQNSQVHKDCLKIQIKEIYGKIVYSHTTHLKQVELLEHKNSIIKTLLIIFSAISACGMLAVILQWFPLVLSVVSVIFTTVDLGLSIYSLSANIESQIASHRGTANNLWVIREEYISLLTDMDFMAVEDIVKKRDDLSHRAADIYKDELKTTSRAYAKAQEALKVKQEQYFSNEELNAMLPEHLRS